MKTQIRRQSIKDHDSQARHSPFDKKFIYNMLLFFAAAVGIVVFSVLLGVGGYMILENMLWIDALANSCMLLGGMGPLQPPKTFGGKLFASFYALYCGLFVLLVLAILVGPVFHKVIDYFHLHDDVQDVDK